MEKGKKILVVDDDKNIRELLKLYIENEEFEYFEATNGEEGLKMFNEINPDAILLDIMMPIMDGWEACREIRKSSNIPILMLTAKGEVFDKILGLELGADDYVVKPFDPKETMARLKAVLRRWKFQNESDEAGNIIEYPNLKIDMSSYVVELGGEQLQMPPKEIELLYFVASNPNKVFTREQLLDKVWGFDFFGDSRTVDVHVKRLREKTERFSDDWALKTVWGVGYKFEVNS